MHGIIKGGPPWKNCMHAYTYFILLLSTNLVIFLLTESIFSTIINCMGGVFQGFWITIDVIVPCLQGEVIKELHVHSEKWLRGKQ